MGTTETPPERLELRAFRLFKTHREKVKLLKDKLKVSESQVVREAIDRLYEVTFPEKV